MIFLLETPEISGSPKVVNYTSLPRFENPSRDFSLIFFADAPGAYSQTSRLTAQMRSKTSSGVPMPSTLLRSPRERKNPITGSVRR
jgi:hypothetical protein